MVSASPLTPLTRLLPAQLTPLVDRADELATIRQRLADEGTRLLTLTGPAGVGKTRLALMAASQLTDQNPGRFPDGVVVVDLTPVREPSLVLATIARSLGLIDTGTLPLDERLRSFLREREAVLLVLDNFEQVLPAAAQLADLVANCPGLALLVTSRVPLQLRWGQTLRLAPLPVPDPREPLPPLDVLLAVPAVALFVERARARRADFALSEKQAPLLAQLAVGLDGLPLALELAAARLDVLSLPTLARRLGNRLRLLASEAPDLPARQQSLEAAVGWSYDLLSAPERLLFRCLGVFVGRVSLDAITAVVSLVRVVGAAGEAGGADAGGGEARKAETPEAARTLHQLLSLAEKSLVLPLPAYPKEPGGQLGHAGKLEELEEDEDPEPAFGMLETVREYAWERLVAEGEVVAAHRAHAHYFLALAERAAPALRGRDQLAWYLRLEREQDNLRAALRWLLDQDGSEGSAGAAEREAGLRLAGALGWFWLLRGHHAEGQRWLEEALSRAPKAGEADDAAARTRALVLLGRILLVQGDFARAQAPLEEGLALAEQRRDSAATAEALAQVGLCAVYAGEVAEGTRRLQEARRHLEALGDPQGLGVALFYLGLTAAATGDVATAATYYEAALDRLEAAGDASVAGIAHPYFGLAEWELGELSRAAAHVQAAVRTGVALRDRLVLSLGAQATVALVGARAEPATWARLLGAADALAQATGITIAWEGWAAGQSVSGLRAQLTRGEGEGAAAYREGQSLPFGQVAALALSLLEEVAPVVTDQAAAPGSAQSLAQSIQPPARSRGPLTAREQEVLRLGAAGRSSKTIGRQLFIAPSTVNYHL
ncbi:MAG TPA: AAA family ATPase, partial [Ktedonobacterales bacterium]|nr:AAA family ATPase [Ktedonobacterales bacterium]